MLLTGETVTAAGLKTLGRSHSKENSCLKMELIYYLKNWTDLCDELNVRFEVASDLLCNMFLKETYFVALHVE